MKELEASEQDFSALAILTFRAQKVLVWRAVLCIVGCLAASLASTYYRLVALLIQPHPLPDGTTNKQLQISPNVPRAAGLEGRCGGLGERTQRQKSSPVENQGQNLAQKHPWKCLYKTSPGSCVIRRGGQRVRNDK